MHYEPLPDGMGKLNIETNDFLTHIEENEYLIAPYAPATILLHPKMYDRFVATSDPDELSALISQLKPRPMKFPKKVEDDE